MNNLPSLDDMQLFSYVAEEMHIGNAANRLGIAKSTASQRLTLLEKRVGTKLIYRSTRKMKLTAAGQVFYKDCLNVIQSANSAIDNLSLHINEPAGQLLITCPEITSKIIMPSMLDEFTKRFPDIRIKLIVQDDCYNLLQGGFDFAFRTGPEADEDMIRKLLGKVPRCLVASPFYLNNSTNISKPQDIEGHQLLVHTKMRKWKFNHSKNKTLDIIIKQPYMESNSLLYLREAAIHGKGLALLPRYICIEEIKNKTLTTVMDELSVPDNNYYLIYPSGLSKSTRHSVFIDFVLNFGIDSYLNPD